MSLPMKSRQIKYLKYFESPLFRYAVNSTVESQRNGEIDSALKNTASTGHGSYSHTSVTV